MDNPIELSLVVCAYKMSRELPRTLFTLSKDYQRGIDDLEYEIVVVDHGAAVVVVIVVVVFILGGTCVCVFVETVFEMRFETLLTPRVPTKVTKVLF